ncbi:TonB-dependent receptor [candidate division KSB1 bacterium]|nr:TonB-dependent receptor [candidate division KSB1 bacterium]
MKQKILLVLICSLVIPALLFAADTGKLSGKVVDKETGDVLPGTNILLVGTSMGAMTDVNGNFLILNVPVGTYDIRASFVGYRTMTVENVRVSSGLTTAQNFELTSQALQAGDITIVAERPLVNPNATNAVRIQGFEDFKNIPTRNVNTIVSLQPGVVTRDGTLYIRGGRAEEVGYFLEGASTRDVVGGTNLVTLIPDALEEFQVQAGGYTAEFGGANAGIVRSTLRSGTPDYQATIQFESDDFSSPGKKFLDTYSYGYNDLTLTASGPVPMTNKKLKFFTAGQYTNRGNSIVRYWKGFNFNHETDPEKMDATNFPLLTTSFGDTIKQGLHMTDNWIENSGVVDYRGAGTLVYDASSFRLRFAANLSYQKAENNGGGNPVSEILRLDRTGHNERSTGLFTLKGTYLISPKTFAEVTFDYFDYRWKSYDDTFGDNWWAYGDSISNAANGFTYKNWAKAEVGNDIDIYSFNFIDPNQPWGYGKQKRHYLSGSVAMTTQWKKHEIRMGGDIQRWTVRTFGGAGFGMFRYYTTYPDIFIGAKQGDMEDYGELANATQAGGYGFDIWGNELSDNYHGLDGPKTPMYGSIYLQDKFEAKQLVINAGVRLDYMDNDDFYFDDPRNPAWNKDEHSLIVDQLNFRGGKWYVSPRLGFAFPATDRTVFHVQFGKFVQAPNLNQMYRQNYNYDKMFTGGFAFMNPPGYALDPQITTQYEIGFNQQFADNASFDVTAFYKDIQDWVTTGRIIGAQTDAISYYNILQNGAFATTKGIEFSLTLRRTNRVAAQVNYTYSSALGTASANTSTIAGTEQGTEVPTIINPLDFNRPHVGAINVDYRWGKDDGGKILEQLGANLLFTFQSGHPYTLRTGSIGQSDQSIGGVLGDARNRYPLEAVNTSYTPWNWNIDLRIDKTVDFGPLAANFYVYVQNLTDRRNVANVYERTGNAWDDGWRAYERESAGVAEANGGDYYWALYDAINLSGNGSNYNRVHPGWLFGTPRQIRAGVRLEF